MLVWYAAVHLTAMSSACANPVMYGFLNENFKQVSLTATDRQVRIYQVAGRYLSILGTEDQRHF